MEETKTVLERKKTVEKTSLKLTEEKPYKRQIVWLNVIVHTILNLIAFAGFFAVPFASRWTHLWGTFIWFSSGFGITAGNHRLWSHKAYKAKVPLRILLTCFSSQIFENSILEWCMDHRVHHKYTDTNADPHNSTRGFFFSHMGWLLVKKHPDVIRKGKALSFDDLRNDPIIMFQHRHKYLFMAVFTFGLPMLVPLLWGESIIVAYFITVTRYVLMLNMTWCVNSFAHFYGTKPYDKNINPVENIWVSLAAVGEGFHNYHHTFPMDYTTSELGTYVNPTTWFINLMWFFGLAYDLRRSTPQMIESRKKKNRGEIGEKIAN